MFFRADSPLSEAMSKRHAVTASYPGKTSWQSITLSARESAARFSLGTPRSYIFDCVEIVSDARLYSATPKVYGRDLEVI